MERYLLSDQPVISEQTLFQTLKMPYDPEDEDTQTILRMLQEAQTIAKPKAIYRVCPITEKGDDYVIAEDVLFKSALVRKNLENTNRIVAYVATCGTELEEWSLQYTDPLENYWADGIKLSFLASIRQKLTGEVKNKYFPTGNLSSMNPGSLSNWPLTEQRTLFQLIGDVTELIGVTLTESCLMLPSKSNSGFFFSSESNYENCQFCPILTCPGRRAPYVGKFE